jgi:hypothetical protein
LHANEYAELADAESCLLLESALEEEC